MRAYDDWISRLPELPIDTFEHAGKLGHSSAAPVLTIVPGKHPVPEAPDVPVAHVGKAQHFVRKYLVPYTYPQVICHPAPDPNAEVVLSLKAELPRPLAPNESDVELIAKQARFYKLSSFQGKRLTHPFWCTVKYGLWTAVVIETELCIQGLPSSWLFSDPGIPDLVLTWFGTWEDIPPYPSLHVLMNARTLVNEASACCPGFRWCATTGSCLPLAIECPGYPTPA